MIPDDVEKIIMTKEDYDRNVEKLLLDKCEAELEIERLNNIIDKAIEYIKTFSGESNNFCLDYHEINDLLNILQGEDENVSGRN